MKKELGVNAADARDAAGGGPSHEQREDRGRLSGWSLVAVIGGIGTLVALFAAGLVWIPRYQASNPPSALQRSDADRVELDDLYLDVTLVTPRFLENRDLGRYLGDREPETVLPVLVGLNTHTGDIAHMHRLPGRLSMVGPDGNRYPSLTEPIVLSQHHNAYMLLFPAVDHHGERFLGRSSGTLAVEARDMGERPLRRFEWELPVTASAIDGGIFDLASGLMLGVALVSAMIVVLSPCALELTLYYTAIISCTVTEGERAAAAEADGDGSWIAGRRRLLVNLAAFTGGFTLLYAASGATVGLIGEGVREPLGQYGEFIQLFGGSLILFFALRVSGLDAPLFAWARGLLGAEMVTMKALANDDRDGEGGPLARLQRWFRELRTRGQRRKANGQGMRARDSFLVGMGLSSACLTCMGGAVLYPLLVYAGITSWYSGLLTLTLYSLGIAIPMVLIALGFFRIRLSLARRVGVNRALRAVSAALLAGIGLLVISGNERILTDVTFRFLAQVSRWGV